MKAMVEQRKKFKLPFKTDSDVRTIRSNIFFYPARIVLLSFLVIITIGTTLLMLPGVTIGEPLNFIDALFTATSATCVTGLIVVNTGTKFTMFGQVIILMLIQIGGLGIMTFSTFFIYLVAGRLSITGRDVVQDTLSQHTMSDLFHLLKSVFLVTISIEALGWGLLTMRFMKTYPMSEAFYLGLFHAISAFCNAGFSLFTESFKDYQGDIFVNVVLACLIILGGLGFIVIFDLYKNRKPLMRWNFSKLTYHTRVVLFITSILIVCGFIFIFGLEYNNSLQNTSLSTKAVASFFQSVTARTAGFNTLEIDSLSNSTLFYLMILMFIGASPGSCGGGIKTSTFAVLTASVISRFRMQEAVNIFYRRIPRVIVSRATSVVFFSALTVAFFTMTLLITEWYGIAHTQSRGTFLEYLFEVISAFGTVGLSTGVTPLLSKLGRILITLLMFIGRLGPLTIALAVRGRETAPRFKYVQESILVG
ncbi:MAG: TrkH family potassium uptake protein [bacterium]